MTTKTATPYLIVNGRAQEAIALYKAALGAEVLSLRRFGDVDMGGHCTEAQAQLVMHAELQIEEAFIMLSDGEGRGEKPERSSVLVALGLDDAAQLRTAFEALSVGGKVVEAPMDAPWGDVFCAVCDRFGVGWMMTAPASR